MPKKLAIIGAGACALVSARHAILNGCEVTLFDKRDTIGGRWNSPNSDFPPKIKDVMSQKEVVEYLLDYAKAHNLQRMAKLNTEVVDVRRHAEYESNGKWLIKYRSCDSKNELKEDEFDCVLICAGMKQKPWRPNDYRAERSFRGRISHASEFESVENYRNKTVVLVGFGNSAANIARTLGSVAKKIYISARREEWTWKQFRSDGRSFDLTYNSRLRYFLRCLTPKYIQNCIWERESLKSFSHGKRPKHRFLATLPVFVDGLDKLLDSERLEIEDDLISFREWGVEFNSGTILNDVDEVIFCTGYEFDFELVEQGRLVSVLHNDFQLYLHMYPVELQKHPTLAWIGFIQPQLGPVWPLAELQARVFFSVLEKKITLPSTFDMRADAEWRRCCINLDFIRTRRHTHIEDFVRFSNELSALIGARPSFAYLISDPLLAWKYYTGPLTPYQHRLVGPNAWSEARSAIVSITSNSINLVYVVLCLLLAIFLNLFILYK